MTITIEERQQTRRRSPKNLRTLILNADYRPFDVASWEWAMKQWWEQNVDIVAYHEGATIRSQHQEFQVPSVVALRRFVKKPAVLKTEVPLNRMNVFTRDDYTCQYCGKKCQPSELTFEHVFPRARGGKTTWDNIVAACGPCNHGKGDTLLEDTGMTLLRQPYAPSWAEIMTKQQRGDNLTKLLQDWSDYAYWDTELEP